MSAFETIIRGVKDVLLLREQVTRLTTVVGGTADRLEALTEEIQALSERLTRMEGFLEGAAAASAGRRRLPKA